MVSAGIRVHRAHSDVHGLRTVLADHGLPDVCYNFSVGVATRDRQWENSNNSAHLIQQETIVSRLLCLSVRQAQPSVRKPLRRCCAGTQANPGSESPLADADRLRGVQSDLWLAWTKRNAVRHGDGDRQ